MIDIQPISEGEAIMIVYNYVKSLGNDYRVEIYSDSSGNISRFTPKEERLISWHRVTDAAQFLKGRD